MRGGVRRVVILAAAATAVGFPETYAQGPRPAPAPAGRPPAAAPARPKAAQAAPVAQPAAAAAAADPRMKPLLESWEKESSRLKTLDVSKIVRIDDSKAWGKEEFRGRAMFEAPNRAYLDFKKVEKAADEKAPPKLVGYERIVCTGTEVWQYRHDTKQVFIFPLDKKDQKRALEEGPLPFLFNMKAAEAEARYVMSLANEAKDHWYISVVPKLKMDQEAFSKAWIKLNRKSFLPDQIILISPDGNSTKNFYLDEIKKNEPINAVNFKGYVPDKPWEIVRDPGEGPANREQQAQGGARPAQPAPKGANAARQPAQAPQKAAAGARRNPPS
jgi:TIGR03009 family protein